MCDDDFTDLRCVLRGCRHAPRYRYRILFIGEDRAALITYLNRKLEELDCHVSYVPSTELAHAFIKTDAEYHLLMFDEQMPEVSGAELVAFARTVHHRAATPCIVVPTDATPENSGHLVEQIKRVLAQAAPV